MRLVWRADGARGHIRDSPPTEQKRALAATLGAFFILDDPIFNGLAESLILGIMVSTQLTLVVIPELYYVSEYKNTADTS